MCVQINLSDLKNIGDKAIMDSVGVGLRLDSEGLGMFDAFLASLSMILVSEVGALSSLRCLTKV